MYVQSQAAIVILLIALQCVINYFDYIFIIFIILRDVSHSKDGGGAGLMKSETTNCLPAQRLMKHEPC